MATASGINIFWSDLEINIPSGWSRNNNTDIAGKYLKGISVSASSAGTIGGGSHSHVGVTHTHTQSAHTHTANSDIDNGSGLKYATGDSGAEPHSHGISSITSASVSNEGVDIALGWEVAEPQYYTVLLIQSENITDIPNNGIVFFSGSVLPTNWYICDGNNSTPNLSNKFLKISDISGSSGSTGGGSHTHTNSAHTHTQSEHYHNYSVGNGGAGVGGVYSSSRDSSYSIRAARSHGHSVGYTGLSANVSSSSIYISYDNTEPEYIKIMAIQNKTGQDALINKIICVWSGNVSEIPAGWNLCDGTNGTPNLTEKFIKITSSGSDVGNTGGSSVHSHTSIPHTHDASHSHTYYTGAPDNNAKMGVYGSVSRPVTGNGHNHGVYLNTATITSSSATVSIAPLMGSDYRPPYYEVAYIQYSSVPNIKQVMVIM